MDSRKFRESFTKAFEHFKLEMSKVRDNRPNPQLVEDIVVEVYGAKMPIKQLGTVNIVDPTLITIQVWDKGNAESIKKAVDASSLGVNTSIDGQLVRIPLPPMSEERREELVKIVKKIAEDAKITTRNIRRDLIDELKEEKVSEDEIERGEKEIQKLTDEFIEKIDDEVKKKEDDLLNI